MDRKKDVVILTIIGILTYAALNFGHPVTPAFLEDVNINERYFGILFSTMAFSLALFSPFWGNKGDNYGRKYIVAIGIAGYGVGQLFFGYGSTIQIILIGRMISGVFAAAIFSNIIASFSEISTNKTRARNISIITSVGMLAGSIGYFIGGKLGMVFSPSNTLIIQGYFSIFVAIIILFFYPKTATIQTERKSFIKNLSLIKTIDDNILYFMFVVLFWTFARNNVAKFFDVFLNNNGFTSEGIGTFIMITGIAGGIATLIFVPILAKRLKLLTMLKVILIFIIISLLITFTVKNNTVLYISYLIYACLTVMYLSIEQTYISKNITSHYGSIIGVRESFKSIGLVTGPLIVTFLFNNINSNTFYFNAIIYTIALLLLLRFIHLQKNRRN
ncbi:MAG: MFS transporter [Bacilli bacterium]